MYLIEYSKGLFVNAENIEIISVNKCGVCLYTKSDIDEPVKVDSDYALKFLNQLQSLNNNPYNIESRYTELREEAR